ncbi:hypothetical protein BCON_0122g00240 [Botryotinia convoluta]|uniref:Uncharacterized protein n=1 Tax=Botryotinia convoluta TaxID=54673 RepID=A0A4Z1IA38_9HELO|nr:hypothetical protein BCON_0122g00240 [Botryotinia convoluta]
MSGTSSTLQNLQFDVNGLYILLSNPMERFTYHWGLYLCTRPGAGRIYHVSNAETGIWRILPIKDNYTLMYAMKIAVIDDYTQQALEDRISQVPVEDNQFGTLTCRTWVLEALWILNEEGHIKFTNEVRMIEEEALDRANENALREDVTVAAGTWSLA